ncbi:class I SAM-dependent methyltransferase [Streptomyces xiamenensis]
MDHHTSSDERDPARHATDTWVFLREAARDLRTTGAVAPSGKALAHALTEPVRTHPGRPLAVLEAGPGTGAITRALLPRLPCGSHLDIVEANPHFADRLTRLVEQHPAVIQRTVKAHVHHGYVQDYNPGERYDVIVSGLPLTNFDPERVEAIMSHYMDRLHPGGTLTYFTYLGTRRARSLLASRTEARRHAAVDALMATYQRTYATGRWTVLANMPPAHVWQSRRPHSTPTATETARSAPRPGSKPRHAQPEAALLLRELIDAGAEVGSAELADTQVHGLVF